MCKEGEIAELKKPFIYNLIIPIRAERPIKQYNETKATN